MQTWLGQVVARTGLKPIVYVSPSFWKTKLGDSPVVAAAGHRLWIAHWTKAALPILPGASWGGLGWSFWQWSNCQKIAGITGCVDGDRFNGSSLTSVTVPAYPAGTPTLATPPTIVGGPQAGKLLAAVPGTWGGGKPVSFGYQWQRCDAAGRGCAAIPAAVGRTYTPTAADVGHALLVRVSAVTPCGHGLGLVDRDARGRGVGRHRRRGAEGAEAADGPGQQPGRAGAHRAGRHLDRVADLVLLPVAPLCDRCDGVRRDCGCGRRHVHDLTRRHRLRDLAHRHRDRQGWCRLGDREAPTATIVAAPVPAPAIENTIAQAGQAGAVTTVTGVATATWQPGALPNQAAVGLVDATSHLSLKGTSVRLSFGAVAPLPWPIDVQYPAAPADAVPGILPLQGVWQPLAELPTPILPPAQQAGTYRDAAGTLHLLTRTAGRIALFAAGKWGDPRYATALKPRVALVNHVIDDEGRRREQRRLRQDHARHAGAPLRHPRRGERHEAPAPAEGLAGRLVAAGQAREDVAGAPAPAGCPPVPPPRARRPAPGQGPAHAADRGARPVRPEVDPGREDRLSPALARRAPSCRTTV